MIFNILHYGQLYSFYHQVKLMVNLGVTFSNISTRPKEFHPHKT